MGLSKVQRPGEVVVITGASAGVGRATAREFARNRASIGLIARGRERIDATQREIESLGGRALALPADVADATQLQQAAEAIEHHFGPIDIWVNNAMATVFAPFAQITPEEFKRATEVTYLGFVYGTMAALKSMRRRNQGVIVQVCSALAYRSIPLQSAYCGAKHAIVGFTDSLRSELMHDNSNVQLTVVNLPAMNTPQFEWSRSRLPRHPQPVPPIYQPEIAAEAIVWAAHHRRREIDVGLPTVIAKNIQKIAPGLADHYLASSGYESQQTDQPIAKGRPDNLFAPAPGDFAAHGTFDSRAGDTSPQLWLTSHRSLVVLMGAALAALIGASFGRSS